GGHVAAVVPHLEIRLVPGQTEALVAGDERGIDPAVVEELAVLDGEHVEREALLDVAKLDVEPVVQLAAPDGDAGRRRTGRVVGEGGQAAYDCRIGEQVELLLVYLLGAAHPGDGDRRNHGGAGKPHALL